LQMMSIVVDCSPFANYIGMCENNRTIINSTIIFKGVKITSPFSLNLLVLSKTIGIYSDNTLDSYVISKIPINTLPGELIIFQPSLCMTFKYNQTRQFDEIDIKLTYDTNDYVDLNNLDWSISIQLFTDFL